MKQGLSDYEIEPFEPLVVREGDAGGQGDQGGQGGQGDQGDGGQGGDSKTVLGGGDAPKDAGGAPESYEPFNLPEGVKLEGEDLEAFTGFAKELNLSQEQAQKLLERDLAVRKSIEERVNAEADAAIKGWLEAARADKEYGGERFDANIAVARKALEAFGTPELKAMLDSSGLGNHPEAIRFMYRVGKAISEDKLVLGDRRQEAKRFYTASDHNV
ncbi:MAG: protease [Gammaproteobacteria bacterium]